MPINERSRREISRILLNRLTSKIDEYEEADDMEKPFFFNLFSEKTVYLASILHSTYTWFGSQWEVIARFIAMANTDKFSSSKHKYLLDGTITAEEEATIGKITRELDRNKRRPNIKIEKDEIKKSYDRSSPVESYNEEVDLFLKTKDDKEIYFEIKSVKPNKNEMRAAKSDLLHIIAMRQKFVPVDNVSVYLALPYNVYPGEYERWTVIKFFKSGEDLLVGKDFWDFLGGENTYEELLDLFSVVGEQIIDKLDEMIRNKKPKRKPKSMTMDDF